MNGSDDSTFDAQLSRRELLRRGALGAAALSALPLMGPGVARAMGAAAAKSPGLSAQDLAALSAALGPINRKYAGKGEVWNIGALLPLSGPGLPQGVSMSRGIALAVKHIKALGGPTIKVDIQDVGTLDVTKGKDAILQMAGNKIPAVVSSYGGVGGVVLPTLASSHILAIDTAGGNSTEQSKPYFWGMRPMVGVSEMPLICNYLRKKMPNVKNLGMAIFNVANFTQATTSELQAIVAKYPPLKFTTIVNPAYGATDFSTAIAALRAGNPDAIISFEFENDAGYFLKQYAVSGINKPVFNFESYIAPIVQIANGGYENQYLAIDDFYSWKSEPVRTRSREGLSRYLRRRRSPRGDSGLLRRGRLQQHDSLLAAVHGGQASRGERQQRRSSPIRPPAPLEVPQRLWWRARDGRPLLVRPSDARVETLARRPLPGPQRRTRSPRDRRHDWNKPQARIDMSPDVGRDRMLTERQTLDWRPRLRRQSSVRGGMIR